MQPIVIVRPRTYTNFSTPPVGIGYLIKAIKMVDGARPVFIDAQRDHLDGPAVIERLKGLDPLIVGFHVFSLDYPEFQKILPQLREAFPKAALLVGGPHPSGLPEHTLRDNPELDYLVRGEAEETIQQLIPYLLKRDDAPALEDIPNLVYRREGQVVMNKQEFVDVKKYGMPDWEALEPDKYPPVQQGTFHKSTKVVPILTSRGCPYPCTFCAGHTLTGKPIRRRDPADVADEIEFLQERYGFEEFIVQDENFTFYKDHVIGFADEIKRRGIKCHFSFPSGIRMDRIDEEIVQRMREMGTYMVTLGIESGSPATLKAMKKGWTPEMMHERIGLLKKYDMTLLGCFILGFPTETMDDINKTIAFALESKLDTAYFGNFLPLPGSEEFDKLLEAGELDLDKIDWQGYSTYFGQLPYHPKAVSEAELLKAVRRATLRFYLRPRTIIHLMSRITHPVFFKSLVFRTASLFRGFLFPARKKAA